MRAKLKAALIVTVALAAMLFVATAVVAVVFVLGLEPWQRGDALAVLQGTHQAVEHRKVSRVVEAERKQRGDRGDKFQSMISEIESGESALRKSRAELVDAIRDALEFPPPMLTASAEAARSKVLDELAGKTAAEVASYVVGEIGDGRFDDAVELLREFGEARAAEVLALIQDPAAAQAAGVAGPGETAEMAVVEAKVDLERRSSELHRHYRAQREKLLLLVSEIRERETEMAAAQAGLTKQLEEEAARRASREKEAAQVNRQKVLKLFAVMDAEQVAEHIGNMVREGKTVDAAGMLRALSDRQAAEILSEMRDPEDRKKVIDEIWSPEEANAAGAG